MDATAAAVLDRLYDDDARQRREGLPVAQRTRNLERGSGELLCLLARELDAKRVLEIGSSNGVSTIWFALAMRETGGHVTGTELIAERATDANRNLAEAGLSDFATVMAGDSQSTIATLTGPFDLVFIDAEKDDYTAHFERAFPLLRIGGLVIADNVTSHDCTEYQRAVRSRADCESLTLPAGRGLELTRRLA